MPASIESAALGLSPAELSPAELSLLQAHWDAFAPSGPSPHVANNILIHVWRCEGRLGLRVSPRYNYTPIGEGWEFVQYHEVPDLTPRRFPLFPGGPLTYADRVAGQAREGRRQQHPEHGRRVWRRFRGGGLAVGCGRR